MAHTNSIESYYNLNLTARQKEVVSALKALGAATDEQIANQLQYPINRVTGRVKELRDKGAVIECGNVIGNYGKRVRVNRLKDFQEVLF